jgi:hypothetical protein
MYLYVIVYMVHLESRLVLCIVTDFIPVLCTSMYHAIVWYQYKRTYTGVYLVHTFSLSMYSVHTFLLKYVQVCTGMYQVQTDLKCMFLSMYSRKKVCTWYILQGHKKYVQVCTEYITISMFWYVISLVFEGYIRVHTGVF